MAIFLYLSCKFKGSYFEYNIHHYLYAYLFNFGEIICVQSWRKVRFVGSAWGKLDIVPFFVDISYQSCILLKKIETFLGLVICPEYDFPECLCGWTAAYSQGTRPALKIFWTCTESERHLKTVPAIRTGRVLEAWQAKCALVAMYKFVARPFQAGDTSRTRQTSAFKGQNGTINQI